MDVLSCFPVPLIERALPPPRSILELGCASASKLPATLRARAWSARRSSGLDVALAGILQDEDMFAYLRVVILWWDVS